MAGNMGHPFYGNQYVSGNYTGSYQYDWIPNSNVTKVFKQSAKTVSENINSVSSSAIQPQSANRILLSPPKIGKIKKDVIIAAVVVSAVAAIGTVTYFLYKHIKKKNKTREEEYQTIELENVGTCKHCGESLNGSEYVDENTSDSHTAYIVCKNCGEKNFAWYPDNVDDDVVV